MKRETGVFLIGVGIGIGILSPLSGCSLQPKTPAPISIRLSPPVKSQVLANPAGGLDSLNCFGVVAHSAAAPNRVGCGGKIVASGFDGTYPRFDSVFTVNAPTTGDLVFDAFGFASNSPCPSIPDLMAGATGQYQIYLLGSISPGGGDVTNTLSIPISFDQTKTFTCGVAPSVTFQDTFLYGSTGALQTTSGASWSVLGSATDFSTTSGLAKIALGVSSTGDFGNYITNLLYTLPTFTKIQLDVTGFSRGTFTTVTLALGVADSGNVGANTLGCSIAQSATNLTLSVGAGSATLIPATSSTLPFTNPSNFSFTCEIRKTPSNQFAVLGDVFAGNSDFRIVSFVNSPLTATSGRVYIHENVSGGGGSAAGNATNFKLVQSPINQP